jgi:hypothetical protein
VHRSVAYRLLTFISLSSHRHTPTVASSREPRLHCMGKSGRTAETVVITVQISRRMSMGVGDGAVRSARKLLPAAGGPISARWSRACKCNSPTDTGGRPPYPAQRSGWWLPPTNSSFRRSGVKRTDSTHYAAAAFRCRICASPNYCASL